MRDYGGRMTKKEIKKKAGKNNLPIVSEEIREEKTETEELDKEGVVVKRTKCEVYSRVVGYIRPVHQWNDNKQAEFEDRVTFEVCDEKKKTKKK